MKTGCTYAKAAHITCMDCTMLDHSAPFPTMPVPVIVDVVDPVIAEDTDA